MWTTFIKIFLVLVIAINHSQMTYMIDTTFLKTNVNVFIKFYELNLGASIVLK